MGTEPDTTGDTAAGDLALMTHSEQRRSPSLRESTVMTERMRRGLTGEISSELKAVLEKVHTLLTKSQHDQHYQHLIEIRTKPTPATRVTYRHEAPRTAGTPPLHPQVQQALHMHEIELATLYALLRRDSVKEKPST